MIEQIYTPISLLKKVFRLGERSLARQEISYRIQDVYLGDRDKAEEMIEAAIHFQESPFREGNSRAIIEFNQQASSLANYAFSILNELGIPMTEEQLLRRLRGQNLVSWSFPFERLGLLGDHRFIQLNDHRWVLNEWELVNDEVFDYLVKQGTTELPIRDIPLLLQIKMGQAKKKCLFLPEFDKRFKLDETRLYILTNQVNQRDDFSSQSQSKKGNMVSDEDVLIEVGNTSFLEVAAAMSQETLEVVENLKTTVVDEVIQDLMGAHIKLEKRSNEMKEEVVNHFSSNNLEAIKALMDEKEKNEKVLLKLKEIVEELY